MEKFIEFLIAYTIGFYVGIPIAWTFLGIYWIITGN